MFKQLIALACMNKKEKNKLALTAGPSDSTEIITQTSPGTSTEAVVDESLNQSIAIQEGIHLNTSRFMSNVLSDVSFDVAAAQNRATPIDFGTREVKADDDVFSEAGRRRSGNLITPSPIPEEIEENLPGKDPYLPPEIISRNRIFEPLNHPYTPRPVKLRKQAHVYNANDSTASASSSNTEENIKIDTVRTRASKSAHQLLKGRITPVLGGSLRPSRAKRHNVAFNANSTFFELDKRRSDSERGHLERCKFVGFFGKVQAVTCRLFE
uniref:Uncharacterized protein n=1 Tax=Caenorhabditis tropicalis TaxID=1561998 RepID=A0A1I7T1F6_9PELO